jgi:hypothetical protein
MKKLFLYSPIGLFTFFLHNSCSKCPDEPAYCSKEINLGEHNATFSMPYDTFQYLKLKSESGQEGGLSINHPSNMAFFYVNKSQQTNHVSDCEGAQSVEKYLWATNEKQSLVTVVLESSGGIPVNPPTFLLKEYAIVDDQAPFKGAVGSFLSFEQTSESTGGFTDEEFMRIMVSENLNGEGSAFEKGYELIPELTINGKTYQQVYANTGTLSSALNKVYYQLNQGFIGFLDKNDVLWRIDE